ncbi:polysaccharide biosynthesis tyrosine autokinase [Microbacterium sp. NPDC057407]|uniref:polysaccharide biosynthesis tyrosine autokinase n=1 Tax=Microbacterium sp. NPDC057407 TaxID=3346120 RepID=UPI00366E66B8
MAVAALAGLGSAMLTVPRYTATAQLFVAVQGDDSVGDLNQGNAFAQGRVASYVTLATSHRILDSVSQKTGVPVDTLASSITASSPAKTVLIDVRADSINAAQSASLANATADALVDLVVDVEAPEGDGRPIVSLKKVQDAVVPTAPFEPSAARNLAIGILLGLAAGIGAALLTERFDTRLRGRQAVEGVTAASVLGAVSEEASGGDLVIRPTHDYSARHEAFRQLRTHLQFANVDGGVRSVLVTSSIPGEGKSTTAVNLATVLAESGMRVLLVDADLRRPVVASLLGLEGSVGLTTVLTGRIPLDEAIQPVSHAPGLQVLGSGVLPPNPSELLASEAMERTLAEAKAHYDIVVIDSPPLVSVSDAGALATLVSGTLLVASVDGRLHRDQLRQALQNLSFVNAKLFGLVLNRVEASRSTSGYYGYGPSSEAGASGAEREPRGRKKPRRGAEAVRIGRSRRGARPTAATAEPPGTSERAAAPAGSTLALGSRRDARGAGW